MAKIKKEEGLHPTTQLRISLLVIVYPEVVGGGASRALRLHQGHGHGRPVLLRLRGAAAEHEGIQEVRLSLARPAFKWEANLVINQYK